MTLPLNELSGIAALDGMAAKSLSARDLAEACLGRIEQRDDAIKAWVACDRDRWLREAERADATPREQRGLLHGLPVGIKDIFDTKSFPTRYGSAIYRDHQPVTDAAAVALLREAGAIVAGKLATTEFAAWPPAPTRNPHHLGHTPGGSSAGSAAAVADHMIPVALGTQTLGSVLRPASYCGVVGFKPSYGRISRVGVKALAEGLDTVGIFARDVRDAALVYSVLSKAPAVCLGVLQTPRLAFSAGPHWNKASEDARQAIESLVAGLRQRGVAVAELDLPPAFERMSATAKLIHDFECYCGHTDERLDHADLMSASFREGLAGASAITMSQYEDALGVAESARNMLPGLFADLDAIITLSAGSEAPQGLQSTGDSSFNSPWTLMHTPCVSVPLLRGGHDLPIGVQVIAPYLGDDVALRVACWLQDTCSKTLAERSRGIGVLARDEE
jgi:Asp-tRNA(Asn)/Glu-tRNA(Gln) amidotransferase A subunit family amidase